METVKTLLDQNYTPRLIATFLNTTVELVVQTMQELTLVGWGEPRLYAYIVARRRPGESRWHENDEATLTRCRERHDGGLLTMMQKKDEGFLIQYALPAVEKGPRRLWFTAPPEIY
jgi:hypothetical protein